MLRKYITRIVEDYIHGPDAWSVTQQDALELSRGFEMGAAGQPRPKARFASEPTARRIHHFRSMGWDMARAAHTGAVPEPKAPPKPSVTNKYCSEGDRGWYEVYVNGQRVLRTTGTGPDDIRHVEGAVKALESYSGLDRAV